MFAIYKREMRAYFTSPVGYMFCAIFFAVSAFLFITGGNKARFVHNIGNGFVGTHLAYAFT